MTEEEDGLLTVRDVARLCGRAEETVRRWIWGGKLPARKLGNQHFIERGDLSRFLAQVSEAQAPYLPGAGAAARSGTGRRSMDHEYAGALDDLREHRGPLGVNREDAMKDIEKDEALAARLAARYGRADVVALVREIRGE
jgi:excisionase family DNA binding protein